MKTFEQQLREWIDREADGSFEEYTYFGEQLRINVSNNVKDGAELLLPMVVDLYNAACEIKYQCARTYGTTDVDKISDLSPVMPLALVLKEIESIQKKIEVQK